MINAILLNVELENDVRLQKKISDCCPQLKISRSVYSPQNYAQVIEEEAPKVVFLEIGDQYSIYSELFQNLENYNFETILIASNRDFVFEAINYKISGYLLKPLDYNSLKSTVDIAIRRTTKKEQNAPVINKSQPSQLNKMIGIPTMEGYEFIPIEEIIRCESYLKCTRVVTKERTDLISSYNIGQFSDELKKYGFYAPHRSHLINLNMVKKYLKEGTIIMQDNSTIPVARRRRNDFINHFPHI